MDGDFAVTNGRDDLDLQRFDTFELIRNVSVCVKHDGDDETIRFDDRIPFLASHAVVTERKQKARIRNKLRNVVRCVLPFVVGLYPDVIVAVRQYRSVEIERDRESIVV